tara:strand:- start:1643 stop:1846 length:204 start_codon:yes stop_codon:yes gene_type:complete
LPETIECGEAPAKKDPLCALEAVARRFQQKREGALCDHLRSGGPSRRFELFVSLLSHFSLILYFSYK